MDLIILVFGPGNDRMISPRPTIIRMHIYHVIFEIIYLPASIQSYFCNRFIDFLFLFI
jgi:hypothetical protein